VLDGNLAELVDALTTFYTAAMLKEATAVAPAPKADDDDDGRAQAPVPVR
jgi:hypothetical protein